jgi:hypothetical protein
MLCSANALEMIGCANVVIVTEGEEFAIMQTHAGIGAQTLRSVHERFPDNSFTAMGIEIAQSHHEWWDGSGYQEGLAGEEIPLCAHSRSGRLLRCPPVQTVLQAGNSA